MSKKSIREILCENCKMNCKLLANNALVFGCFFNHSTNEGLQKAFESYESQYKAEIEELKKKVEELEKNNENILFKNDLLVAKSDTIKPLQEEIGRLQINASRFESKNKELQKKIEELESVINSACDEEPYSFSSYCSGLIYNHDKEIEEIKKKLEKADFLARAFAKECSDSEKARAYLKENV